MQQFEIKRGLKANLSKATPILGCFYITTDTNELFVGSMIDGFVQIVPIEFANNFDQDIAELDTRVSILESKKSEITFSNFSELPEIGDLNHLYIVLDTKSSYIWNGQKYELIGADADLTSSIEDLDLRTAALEVTINGKPANGEEGSENFEPAVIGLVDKVSKISADLESKADKASTLAGYGISDAYTQNQVNELISNLTHFTVKIIQSPDQVIDSNILYLIKDDAAVGNDIYKEYIYIESLGPTLIGDTSTNLADYVTLEDLDSKLEQYAKSDIVVTKEEFADFIVNNNQAISDAQKNAVNEVSALLETKANKDTVYTKAELDSLISDLEQTIDSVKDDLSNYISTNDEQVADLHEVDEQLKQDIASNTAKLVGIDTTVIEFINLTKEEIIDNIPELDVATDEKLGGIKSSNLENTITVDSDGIASVNSLNVDRLTQTAGTRLILDGGDTII